MTEKTNHANMLMAKGMEGDIVIPVSNPFLTKRFFSVVYQGIEGKSKSIFFGGWFIEE